MPDETPKLTVLHRKKGRPRSTQTELQRRTSNALKLAEVEAQKVAVAEMVVERMDEIIGLLRGAGFRFKAGATIAPSIAHPAAVSAPVAPAILHPCKLHGVEGIKQGPGGGWMCRACIQIEEYGDAGNRALPGGEPIKSAMPDAPPAKPSGARQIIHPVAEDVEGTAVPFDPLKGALANAEVIDDN